jgi:Zn-dependent M28 family amino/carboxypeptidase
MQYYAQKNNNDRTLIFCAFAGEELGLKGSQVLAEIINPATVKALVNIEMIGRHGAVGKNSFFITGGRRSNLAAHFKKALAGKGLRIKSEPNEEKQLFMRSDNFPFALNGIPAHTLMCSDDDDGCYHQTCDEATRMDIPNMTEIIKAIVLCSQALVDGSFTPSRIRL